MRILSTFFSRIYLRSLLVVFILSLFIFGVANAAPISNTGAPSGFSIDEYISGFDTPIAAEFANDERLFVAQKDGTVKIVDDGKIISDPFYVIENVNNYVDRGLLDITLHPDFPQTPYVYLLYTYDNNPSHIAGPKTAQLIRVTAAGNTVVEGSEEILLGTNVGDSVKTSCNDFPVESDCIPSDSLSHTVGSVVFAPDGTLFITTGDGAGYEDLDRQALRAQDLNNLAGKVLRINEDGTAPSDNPFFDGDPTSNKSKVWALGLRNSFRFGIRESDGLMLLGDVGWNYWEEINVVEKGKNLGWPCYEGIEQQNGTGAEGVKAYKDEPECQNMYASSSADLTFPIYHYPHPPSSAVVGGLFYTGSTYPEEYQGTYFFADYAKNQIYTLELNDTNSLVQNSVKTFASNVNGPVQFFKGPDGILYYVAIYTGSINKITYTSDNQVPIAVASSDITSGASPLTVAFSSAGSTDPENDPLTFEWDFNDGSPVSTDPNPTHTFVADGKYTVQLRVIDSFNNQSLDYIDVSTGQTAPSVTILTPQHKDKFAFDTMVEFTGSATDAVDGDIDGSKLQWKIYLQHCPLSDCHTHPVYTTTGNGGSFEFPNHDSPYYVEIELSVTNSSGLTTTESISVYDENAEINNAPKLDGVNDYITADNSQDFKLQEFSVETWIKSLTVDTYGSDIFSLGNNWGLRLLTNGNANFFFNGPGGWQDFTTIGQNMLDGVWHYIGITKGLDQVKIYIDGILKETFNNVGQIHYNYGETYTVGRHGDGDDNFTFNGQIDELRFWNVVRTEDDISGNYNKVIDSNQSELIAHYSFEEGEGNTSADLTGNYHDLLFHNGVIWRSGIPLVSEVHPTPQNPLISSLVETFAGDSLDTFKWGEFNGTNITVDDQLIIALTENAVGYYGIFSKNKYTLIDSSLFIEATQIPNINTTTEFQVILQKDVNNLFVIGTTNGSLMTRARVNGINTDSYIPWNSQTMRFWRIREVENTLYFETSSDNTVWTIQTELLTPFDVSDMSVILQAGTWQPVTNPGTGHFANLNGVGSNTPTLTPSPTPTPSESFENPGIGFDGVDSFVSIVNDGAYNLSEFTLETWFKASDVGLYGGEIISNGNNYGLRLLPDGNLRFFIHVGGLIWRNFETNTLNLLDNVWHSVSVTKSATAVKIYVDGLLTDRFESTEPVSYTLGDTIILGRHGDGDSNFNYTGTIDELRMFNKVLDDAEIAGHYKYEYWPDIPTELIGYWKFNEGEGLKSFDATVSNVSADLLSGTTWAEGYPRNL